MRVYTNHEYADMVLVLGECRGNQRAAATLYRQRYPERQHPGASTIWRVRNTLREYGTFHRPRRPAAEREAGRRTLEIAVLAAMYANPHGSTRAFARQLNISQALVWKILRKYRCHPYRLHRHQALQEADHGRREVFCLRMQACAQLNGDFLSHVLFSDESTFHRDGNVNTHNVHYWAESNPFWLREDNHQVRWKVNVWCGILGDRLIGPYFLPQRLNADGYLEFLRHTLSPDVLDLLPLATHRRLWFQQDGAPVHNARHVAMWLNDLFPQQWIGTHGPIRWPARSPDLTPLDFFLWGFLKSHVYDTEPQDVQDLQGRIRRAAALVTPQMLQNVQAEVETRFEECLAVRGRHFEHHD